MSSEEYITNLIKTEYSIILIGLSDNNSHDGIYCDREE